MQKATSVQTFCVSFSGAPSSSAHNCSFSCPNSMYFPQRRPILLVFPLERDPSRWLRLAKTAAGLTQLESPAEASLFFRAAVLRGERQRSALSGPRPWRPWLLHGEWRFLRQSFLACSKNLRIHESRPQVENQVAQNNQTCTRSKLKLLDVIRKFLQGGRSEEQLGQAFLGRNNLRNQIALDQNTSGYEHHCVCARTSLHGLTLTIGL